ncbi:DUF262 domain-containing protein [Listeria monocytogenes]|nr:DUF262 domain-containing protein [Listeria monocytogenes]EAD7009385.1 DUF262 domain-containing protein [Listeria monocytogenes]EAD9914506.1 DUF262 domain-containing protein [Listeria monocytogenes]EAD9917245.1 DUF262 domain-containing protein [Listeria monocytogenes]EAG7654318.1 DUF262 domain-containing protein [Listeria monocytogenes]
MAVNLTNDDLEENLVNAENDIDIIFDGETYEYKEKRKKLEDLKIQKHSWSLSEIYQKIKADTVNLAPIYQREEVWSAQTQAQFIESLFIGIMIPPVYLAEIRPKNPLESIKYEVVDGKQRLISIFKFFKNELKLSNGLQYYGDIFLNSTYSDIEAKYPEEIERVLSSVIDLYVIAQNADPEIKYDVFARLNQGNIKLTQAELRKAIYASELTNIIYREVDKIDTNPEFKKAFTKTDRNRFRHLNRVYQSVAYVEQYRVAQEENKDSIMFADYNSRPRDMINLVLQKYQSSDTKKLINIDDISKITLITYQLKKELHENPVYREIESENELPRTTEFSIDCLIPFYSEISNPTCQKQILEKLYDNQDYLKTFERSPSTTSMVNKRLGIVYNEIFE